MMFASICKTITYNFHTHTRYLLFMQADIFAESGRAWNFGAAACLIVRAPSRAPPAAPAPYRPPGQKIGSGA